MVSERMQSRRVERHGKYMPNSVSWYAANLSESFLCPDDMIPYRCYLTGSLHPQVVPHNRVRDRR